MTPQGTFVMNGDERVVVTQMHRSPGVSFEESSQLYGKVSYRARIVPYYGSWLEFEFDQSKVLNVYIDRRRKFPVSVLLRAFGYSSDESILKVFGGTDTLKINKKSDLSSLGGRTIAEDIVDPESKQVLFEKYEVIAKTNLSRLEHVGLKKIKLVKEDIAEIVSETLGGKDS